MYETIAIALLVAQIAAISAACLTRGRRSDDWLDLSVVICVVLLIAVLISPETPV